MANIYELIKTQLPISKVIGEYMELKGRGTKYTGLCPFHGEKTPSFHVDDEKGFYYCFGCKASGDVIKFIQETQKLDAFDACKFLAEKYRIDISNVVANAQPKNQKVFEVLKDAAALYHKFLFAHNPSKKYLIGRGVNKDAVQRFVLGYAPKGNLLYQKLKQKYREDLLLRSGVVQKSEDGRFYDRFRDRIMFPIIDQTGRVVGFGGRAFGNINPKYLNSSESPFFKKSELLYSLNNCKNYLKEKTYILVVEGYMDVVSLSIAGIQNVVATLGTSLTEGHINLLKRYTSEVILCYDSDDAGINAALRAIDLLIPAIPTVRVCLLGEGLDPDEYIKKYGAEEFLKAVEGASTAMEFKLNYLSNDYNLNDTASFNHFLKKACHEINRLPDQFDKNTYAQYLVDHFGASIELIQQTIRVAGLKKSVRLGEQHESLTCEEQILRSFVTDYKRITEDTNLFAKITEVEFSPDLSIIFYAMINHFEEYSDLNYSILADEIGIERSKKLQEIMDSKQESRRIEVLLYNIELQKINELLEKNDSAEQFDALSKRKRAIMSEMLKLK